MLPNAKLVPETKRILTSPGLTCMYRLLYRAHTDLGFFYATPLLEHAKGRDSVGSGDKHPQR